MSLHGYSDGEYDAGGDDDNVTLISKLDVSHSLHLHPNDSVALIVVFVKLKGTENYQKQFDALTELPRCTCHVADDFKKHNKLMKLMQFLMGLDDQCMQIRSSILSREVLPDVRSAYAIISNEESHRVASGNISKPSSNVRPNDNRSRRTNGGSNLICKNYGFNGHTIDRCFKIISYPLDFGKKKAGQNFKGKNVSNNAVGTSSSFGFSDEQLSTMISIIKENPVNGKGVQANMVEAFITKIENMPLTDYLRLFDMLVVPVYCVSLMSVHKVARDSKLVIAFDELKCYILNQDLKAGKVLGLVDNLVVYITLMKIKNDKFDVMCETCQRAKQTREPFPLSDHISTELGLNNEDLFNLDGSIDHSEIPYDDERSDASPNRYGTYFSHSGSTFDTHNENEGGHSLGSNVAASEDDRSANPEDNINNTSKGNGPLFLSQNDQDISKTHNLRRSFRPSVFPRNYNYFFVESKVKYGLKKYVNYTHLSKDNHCFTSVLNKSFEPKSFEEAAKHQPWIDAMNSEMDALYKNNTWDLVELPKGRKAIDDIIITGNNLNEINKFKQFLKNKFMIKDLGKLKYFLGIKVLETPTGVCLNQRKYCLELIDEFGLLASKPSYIPMQPNISLSSEPKDDDPLLDNVTDYQKLIGKLIYLTTTRLDIAYTVSCLSQFMHSPLKSHLKTALKVTRYLKGCPGKDVNVIKTSTSVNVLKAYTDADWARCTNTRRYVTGYCVFMNNSVVSWKSKTQNTISKSSTEAEYRALASVISKVIWVLKILKYLDCSNLLPVKVFCDNNLAIKIVVNPVFYKRTKHLEIDLHFVREKILVGVIKTEKIDTANQIADIVTKGLDTKQHNLLCYKLGLIDMFQNKLMKGVKNNLILLILQGLIMSLLFCEYDAAGDDDNVTLISKFDVSHPLHFHPNDSMALTVVSMKLKGNENYQVCLVLWRQWDRVNAIVFGWILNSISEELFLDQIFLKRAKRDWMNLKKLMIKCTCHDADDFKKHNQLMKLMQFLMGLDDHYMQIRSSILSREVLPNVRSAYAIISSEESHRVASGNIFESSQRSQTSAFSATVPNIGNFQRSQVSSSHPNGTEAFITKIGNMPLTAYLTLFDMLVVPEYCVSLMSVHKVARDSKLVIAFDELKLGHPADQVLNVLRPNLLFENDKSDVMCETCQRAKHTREPFPLSDHISTELGLNNEDFFNSDGFIDHSEIPYVDERSDPSPNGYGTPFSHSGSTSDTHNENEGGHSLGSDAAASEDDRSANLKDNINNTSEGNGPSLLSQNDQDISKTHNLRSFEPKSFEEAAKHHPWIDAMNSEMDALYRNNTWDLVKLPKGRKAIGFKWVWKIKYISDREIERYKAKLVAKGFNQREGINFDETFSPVVKIVTVRGDDDNVTLINKLDVSHLLHLHPNDFVALTVVSVKLKGAENYQVCLVLCYEANTDNYAIT
ncbi:ribonuclease H-like domain-containing protein [Tanacetum coccineum]|uniref:Ribonuclease H-like domain-containing protein n=1 Tax=Tanacetum coccineum TaxID=301880 RepID=A0ABQ5HZ87_9ASTR